MMQIVEQTHEEKVAMYMKCSKKELIEMLIQCNNLLDALGKRVESISDHLEVTYDDGTTWKP